MRFGARALGVLAGLFLCVVPKGSTAGDASDLTGVLRLDEVIAVMHDEGLDYGADIDRDMLGGLGGAFWAAQVLELYDPARMYDAIADALGAGMTDRQIQETIAFFDTDRAQRILTLENTAREAMADPDIEAVTRETFHELKGTGDSRLAAIKRFIEVNDLIERNVAGSLNSSYDFLRGLNDGGANDMSEEAIIADVWSQESETRTDTEIWVYGFLLLAYQPLSDDTLEEYIDFSAGPTGQALNAALFDGFNQMYRDISYGLGILVAKSATASDL